MLDNICKFLAETFPEDYATWLLGSPIKLTELSPTELSLEPIRADSLILEQSEDLVLHLEFQTRADENIGFRMLDYRFCILSDGFCRVDIVLWNCECCLGVQVPKYMY